MRIDLNAKIRTSDGHDAGNIHRVLIDPTTERITGFVVSTRRLLGRDVILGEDMFAGASADGETITLNLNKKELDTQPSFEADDFVVPPAGWSAPNLGYTISPESFLWPEDAARADVGDKSRPSIKKGDTVKDRDGDMVGTVEEIRFDEMSGDVLSVIVKAYAGLERLFGGGKVAGRHPPDRPGRGASRRRPRGDHPERARDRHALTRARTDLRDERRRQK